MKVYYSPYTLTPLKRANRLSSLELKHGIYLKGVLGDKMTFADYFPHLPLGDRSNEQFLSEFKFQDHEYDRKVFDFILRDHLFQKSIPKTFTNHQLWTGAEALEAKVVKYKMTYALDRNFMDPLEKGLRLRLDANALFQKSDYSDFIKSIPEKFHSLIDYIEDPMGDKDWSGSKIPRARDFIEGTPFEYYIYKPNCEFKPKCDAQIIYSSYLGSDLGRWHTYSELSDNGDLSLTHGIISKGFFQEEKSFLDGSYKKGFIADKTKVNQLYQDVYDSDWKLLCSM